MIRRKDSAADTEAGTVRTLYADAGRPGGAFCRIDCRRHRLYSGGAEVGRARPTRHIPSGAYGLNVAIVRHVSRGFAESHGLDSRSVVTYRNVWDGSEVLEFRCRRPGHDGPLTIRADDLAELMNRAGPGGSIDL